MPAEGQAKRTLRKGRKGDEGGKRRGLEEVGGSLLKEGRRRRLNDERGRVGRDLQEDCILEE
jgi:hypothetical protein